MNKRSQILQSKKVLERRRKKRILTYSIFSVAGISVIVAFVLLFRAPFLRISKVVVEGAVTIDKTEVEERTHETLAGVYLGVFPKAGTLFLSKAKIKEMVLESFKEVEKVAVSRKGLSGLAIKIEERKPSVLVCPGFHEKDVLETEEKCFFADDEGYVFAPAPEFSSGVYVRYYIRSDEGVDPVGKNFVDTGRFKEFQAFVKSLTLRGISVLGMLVGEDGMYELYIKNRDLSEAIIYFDDRSSLEKTSSNLTAFWDSAQNKKLGTSTTPIFEYINLRFGNNIFYVLK
ncbi:MAG: hypothetical protein V4697_02770 [Patescibacteria group bacterium]